MEILESYLNDYKQAVSTDSKSNISNIMLKYIIGSCLRKMKFRAFHWASYYMIGSLHDVKWATLVPFEPVHIEKDHRLSSFLSYVRRDEATHRTFGEWVMTYNLRDFKSPDSPPSLDDFLTFAMGSDPRGLSTYLFNSDIAYIFHNLLLSSIYAYMCSIKQLRLSIGATNPDEIAIKKYVGEFSIAIRILFLVSHSNAMRAYFTHVKFDFHRPTQWGSFHHKDTVDTAIHAKLLSLGWREDRLGGSKGGDKNDWKNSGLDGEDEGGSSDYFHGFDTSDVRSIYRRAFMSFVDHYAALRLLERRSSRLSNAETINLSLIAICHPRLYYCSWEVMEKVIERVCQDFGSNNTSNCDGSQNIIDKIKRLIDLSSKNKDVVKAITTFETLLNFSGLNKLPTEYPLFDARIHCESSLAAILCRLHDNGDLEDSDNELRGFFQASPSSHSLALSFIS